MSTNAIEVTARSVSVEAQPGAIFVIEVRDVFSSIKNRYGTAFAREARTHLSKYIENQGFFDKLTKLFPIRNKDLALLTLKENLVYVQTFFEQAYPSEQIQDLDRDIASYNIEQLKELAVELAAQAGYKLYGPLTDIAQFESDNRPGEKLCTFNSVSERLAAYHMLWLRHRNYQEIKPADELRDENDLSEEWRDYLKEQDRWDRETNTYDLQGLKPQREDPYGTSSMLVQISKTGLAVSITNRYNHTLKVNPDQTFNGNLDRVRRGLREAVYRLVDRPDLLSSVSSDLSDGYVVDNDGGIHPYYYEANNVNFGHYESISNGVVESINPDQYYILSPSLYVRKGKNNEESKKSKKGSEERSLFINLDLQSDEFDNFEKVSNEDSTQTVRCKKGDRVVVTYTYSVVNNKVESVLMEVFDNVRAISNNPSLTELRIAKTARVESISNNPSLTKLWIGEGAQVGDVFGNSNLTELRIAEGAYVGDILGNSNLTELRIAETARVESISNNPSLTKLWIAEGAYVGDILGNSNLTELWIGAGAQVDRIVNNHNLTEISVGELVRVGSISNNRVLRELRIGEGVEIYDLRENTALAQLTIAKKARVDSIVNNHNLTEIRVGEEAQVRIITENPALAQIAVGRMAQVQKITKNDRLKKIDLATGAIVSSISNNPELETLIIGEGAHVEDIFSNPKLP